MCRILLYVCQLVGSQFWHHLEELGITLPFWSGHDFFFFNWWMCFKTLQPGGSKGGASRSSWVCVTTPGGTEVACQDSLWLLWWLQLNDLVQGLQLLAHPSLLWVKLLYTLEIQVSTLAQKYLTCYMNCHLNTIRSLFSASTLYFAGFTDLLVSLITM